MTKNIEQESDVSQRATRALSKALFGGAQYRVEIGAAIAEGSVINTAELAEKLGIVRQSVNQELLLLERIGLLARMPKGSDRKVYLIRQESSYWTWCKEASTHAAGMLEREPQF
jgi:predicted transcriptional regulator